MRIHEIKILHTFVTYLPQIYLFSKKKSFFSRIKGHLQSWQLKEIDLTVENGIFFDENLGVKELITS